MVKFTSYVWNGGRHSEIGESKYYIKRIKELYVNLDIVSHNIKKEI